MSRVTKAETWVVRVPYDEGRSGTHIVLRLSTDDGLHGIGYVTSLSRNTLGAQTAAVQAFAEQTIGRDVGAAPRITDSFLRSGARPQFDGLVRSAAGVVDIALWDLKAQSVGQPLFRLLGAEDNLVDTYAGWALWWQLDLDTLSRNAIAHRERGFRAMKFRMGGIRHIDLALDRASVMRDAVGSDVDLLVDLNGAWTINEAIEIGTALGPYRLGWIEDPINPDDHGGLAQIAATLATPVCTGETYQHAPQFRDLLDARGADCVMIDLEVGGVTEWLRLASLAATYGIEVANHGCTEIAAHLVAAVSNGRTVEYVPWAEPLFVEVPALREGQLELSERPGLGLELDESALAKYAIG
jgi:L-alanine-DL-glutamate epimerase-like enolase superfamily enzyme